MIHPCGPCPRRNAGSRCQVVPPSGPQPCDVLFVGEGPAKEEAKQLVPFVGDTGEDFNYHLLPLAHTSRPNIRVTNAFLCPLPGFRNPTKEEGQACLHSHLRAEIHRTNPRFLIPMGAVACHTLAPWATLIRDYGIPRWESIEWLDWEGWVVPMFHPASGMYDSRQALMVQEAFQDLRFILAGTYERPVDAHPNPDYRLLTGKLDVVNAFRLRDRIALDTEYGMKGPKEPHCLSFSQAPGTGYMILASDTEALRTFNELITDHFLFDTHPPTDPPEIIFHHVFADKGRLRQMGVHIPWPKVHDTIVDTYNLGLSSQGLKTLAHRLLGCQMQDFLDVVGVYNLNAALTYMESIVRAGEEAYWRPLQPWLTKRQHTLYRKARMAISNTLNKASDPIQIWEGWPEPDRNLAISTLGPFPDLGLACAPMHLQIPYACADADITLRLAPVLDAQIHNLRSQLNV